jgi:CBS domain-containing protein
MFAKEIISDALKPLEYSDTGEHAMVLMHDYNVSQLPVVDEGKYVGLISLDEILSLRHLNDPLKKIHTSLTKPYVHESSHLFDVMKAGVEFNVKVIPVLSDTDDSYLGIISAEGCMRAFALLNSVRDEGSVLELEVPIKDFQLSEIARIVESNGATILAYYSNIIQENSLVEVTLKLNTNELSAIVAAFERYEYIVKGVHQEEEYTEDLKDRYDAFMRFMEV